VAEYAIDTLDGVVNLFSRVRGVRPTIPDEFAGEGRMFCTTCGQSRRMDICVLLEPDTDQIDPGNPMSPPSFGVTGKSVAPCLLRYTCVECRRRYTALVYRGPSGPALAIFPESLGGLATPHTPEAVAYYLDQAHKSESVSALSAAITMFRAAIEHLLFEQGYTVRTLGSKITRLEADIKAGSAAPRWARELDIEFLRVLKELGNYSIHPNEGDVSKQAQFDGPLLVEVKATVVELLDLVYEEPRRRADRLAALKAAEAEFMKPAEGTTE
jgi:hypothetical protein